MSYLTYAEVRAISKETFGLDEKESVKFMFWLEKQPQLNFNSADEDYQIQSTSGVGSWLKLYLTRPVLIGNAFSLNMLSDAYTSMTVHEIDLETVSDLLKFRPAQSCIGHADTAAIVSGLIGQPLPAERATVKLGHGDELLVAQYSGPRLEEGTTTLPEGANIKWMLVSIN